MKTFTKWLILNGGMITAAFFAHQKGLINLVLATDISYICLTIFLFLIAFSGYCGKLCALIDNSSYLDKQEIHKKMEIVEFVSDNMTVAGLMGTLIGMSVMMYSTLGTQMDTNAIIQQLKIGSSTAFYTTIVGIIGNLLLNMQLLIMKQVLPK